MDTTLTTLLATDVICLEPGEVIESPALWHTAACMRTLRPWIVECSDRHGHGALLAALMVTIADMAADYGAAGLIADALHESAALTGQANGSRDRLV